MERIWRYSTLVLLACVGLLVGVIIAPIITAQTGGYTPWTVIEESDTRIVLERSAPTAEPTATSTTEPTATATSTTEPTATATTEPTATATTEPTATATTEPTATATTEPTATATQPSGVAPINARADFLPYGVYERGIYINSTTAADVAAHGFDSWHTANGWPSWEAEKINEAAANSLSIVWQPTEQLKPWYDDAITPDKTLANAKAIICPIVQSANTTNYPNLVAYNVDDEPYITDREEVWLAQQAFIECQQEQNHAVVPAMPVLIANRIIDIYQPAVDDILLMDAYPVRASSAPGELKIQYGAGVWIDYADHLRNIMSYKAVDDAGWLVMQAHQFDCPGCDSADLRLPSVEELRMQQWIAVGEGFTGFYWFRLDDIDGMVGLEGSPTNYAEAADLGARVQSIETLLLNAYKVDDAFTVGGATTPYASSLRTRDGSTDYVVAVNRDVNAANLTLSSTTIVGDLRDVETGEVFAQGAAIPFRGGDGRMFEVIPEGSQPTPTPTATTEPTPTATATTEPTATATTEPTATPTTEPTATPTTEPTNGQTQVATGLMLGPSYAPRHFYLSEDGGTTWAPTYEGKTIEGRLMNFRAANAIFDDDSRTDDDPDANVDAVIANLPEYKAHGIQALTVSLQGGNMGTDPFPYGQVSAFNPDGSLRADWMARADRLIEAADQQDMVIILTYFYQRHDQVLTDANAVRAAVSNATDWLIANDHRNVIIEIANEYNLGLRTDLPAERWQHPIIANNSLTDGIGELINLAKSRFDGLGWRLPVSASSSGILWSGAVADVSDLALIHGNGIHDTDDTFDNTAYLTQIRVIDKYPYAAVMNEDDNGDTAGQALFDADTHAMDDMLSVEGGSWGLMWKPYNQYWPFGWSLGDPAQLTTEDGYFHAILNEFQQRAGIVDNPTPTPTPTTEPTATPTTEPTATPTTEPTPTVTTQPTGSAGVPSVALDLSLNVEEWWATHPMNPASVNHVPVGAISPPAGADEIILLGGMSIQTAIDNAPPEGRVIYLSEGEYVHDINLAGKSHIHIIGLNNNVVIRGGYAPGAVEANNQVSNFKASPLMDDIWDMSSNLKAYTNNGNNSMQAYYDAFVNPIEDFYFKNVIFDGNNTANHLFVMRGVKDVVFDQVTVRNFVDPGKYLLGIIHTNVFNENIWIRDSQFYGSQQMGADFDGLQGGGVLNTTFHGSYNRAPVGYFVNNDFSVDLDRNGSLSDEEMRMSRYIVIEGNTFKSGARSVILNSQHTLVKGNTTTNHTFEFAYVEPRLSTGNPAALYDTNRYEMIDVRFINNTATTHNWSFLRFIAPDQDPADPSVAIVGQYHVTGNSTGSLGSGYPFITHADNALNSVIGPNVVCGNSVGGSVIDGACSP